MSDTDRTNPTAPAHEDSPSSQPPARDPKDRADAPKDRPNQR